MIETNSILDGTQEGNQDVLGDQEDISPEVFAWVDYSVELCQFQLVVLP